MNTAGLCLTGLGRQVEQIGARDSEKVKGRERKDKKDKPLIPVDWVVGGWGWEVGKEGKDDISLAALFTASFPFRSRVTLLRHPMEMDCQNNALTCTATLCLKMAHSWNIAYPGCCRSWKQRYRIEELLGRWVSRGAFYLRCQSIAGLDLPPMLLQRLQSCQVLHYLFLHRDIFLKSKPFNSFNPLSTKLLPPMLLMPSSPWLSERLNSKHGYWNPISR